MRLAIGDAEVNFPSVEVDFGRNTPTAELRKLRSRLHNELLDAYGALGGLDCFIKDAKDRISGIDDELAQRGIIDEAY